MKKQLTIEQHSELIKLGYKDKGAGIGDLIEFIKDNFEHPVSIMIWENISRVEKIESKELCDAIFEAIKEFLIEKKK